MYVFWGVQFGFPGAYNQGDFARAGAVAERMAWFGRDSGHGRLTLARALLKQGDRDAAISQYERSLALGPSLGAYSELARIHEQRERWEAALGVLESAVEVYPERPGFWHRAGMAALRSDQPVRAVEFLGRALALQPRSRETREALASAERMAQERRAPP